MRWRPAATRHAGASAPSRSIRRQLHLHADHAVRHRRRTPTTAPTRSRADSFSYTVTDAHGNSATGTITVNIVDDVPTATLDSGNVNEGALLTVAASGVLANDVAGADGFTAGGGVVGVRAAGSDLTTRCRRRGRDQHCGAARHAASECRRQLHLPVDGEQHHGGHHRRVRLHGQGRRRRPVDDDADDQPCRTPRCAPTDNDVTVNEAALDTTVTPPDLAAGHGDRQRCGIEQRDHATQPAHAVRAASAR